MFNKYHEPPSSSRSALRSSPRSVRVSAGRWQKETQTSNFVATSRRYIGGAAVLGGRGSWGTISVSRVWGSTFRIFGCRVIAVARGAPVPQSVRARVRARVCVCVRACVPVSCFKKRNLTSSQHLKLCVGLGGVGLMLCKNARRGNPKP